MNWTDRADPLGGSMLRVTNLQKRYDTGEASVEAIRSLSFDVQSGEVTTIVGPSGAGKSTLLRCLAGLETPTAGKVTLGERELSGPAPEITIVFQDYTRSLLPWYSVWKNVSLPLQRRVRDSGERSRRVDRALEEVGLADFGDLFPWQLSGGMQQRVALARGIAYQAEILLMDEPFASVDAQTRSELEDLILRVHKDLGVTVLFVTHDIEEAVYLGHRVLVLSARPAVLKEVAEIDLPWPRDQLTTKSDQRFVDMRAQILRLIQEEKMR